jgi:PHD/YefM family antitoxin component YafN of YafNO toxin-antitoxin module
MNDIELKQAYSIMGLPDDAPMDDVDKRYALLLKKQHSQQARTSEDSTHPEVAAVDYEQINQAYRQLLQHHKEKASLAFEQEYYSAAHRKWKLDKLDHFWQYNKFRIISAVIILAVIFYGINTFMDKRAERIALSKLPPADIEIMFYGDYYTEDIPKLEKALLEQMPEWKRVIITVTQVPSDPSNPYAISLQQKAVIMLMTQKPDIYVMDKSTFEILSVQQALLEGKDWLGSIEARLTDKQKVFGQSKEDSEPKLYGVDVSRNTVFESKGLHSVDQIIGMRFDSTKQQAAQQLVDLFLNKAE